MNTKLVLVIFALATMLGLAQAQQGGPPPNAPRPTKEDALKVVQVIGSDNTKMQLYCQIGELNQQIVQADAKHDAGLVESLDKQAADLAGKIGPEYVKLMDGLDQLDEDSSHYIASALMSLDKLCGKQ
jgi:hypothetical protein